MHQHRIAGRTDGDHQRSPGKPNAELLFAPGAAGFHRRDRCGASTGSTGLGPPRAALEDIESHRAAIVLGDEAHIDALGEVRVALDQRTELEACITHLVKRHRVRVAHRHAADAEVATVDGERMVEPGSGGAQRKVRGHQRWRRHLDGDRLRTWTVHDHAGVRTRQCINRHLERRFVRPSRKVQRGTANAVAAHLRNRAIGIDHVHRRRMDVEHEHTVATDPTMAITKRDCLVCRELHPRKRFLLDDEEVVTEAFVLVERQSH